MQYNTHEDVLEQLTGTRAGGTVGIVEKTCMQYDMHEDALPNSRVLGAGGTVGVVEKKVHNTHEDVLAQFMGAWRSCWHCEWHCGRCRKKKTT